MKESTALGKHLELDLQMHPHFNKVRLDGVEVNNVRRVVIAAEGRLFTEVTLTYAMSRGEEMHFEGWLVPKDVADLYGTPDEIVRWKRQAERYEAAMLAGIEGGSAEA